MERNAGFDTDSFRVLMQYEDWHWWFQHRNTLIIETIRKFSRSPKTLLEIGCGNGLVTEAMHKAFPTTRITGTEFFDYGLKNARARLPALSFHQLDARDLDGTEAYDAVCAFDVLEHIDADIQVMKAIRRSMKDSQSRFYITVPQHMALWSQADVYAKHERRYSYREMREKLKKAGFAIEYRTSYVFLLAPLMILSRYLKRSETNFDIESEFRISKVGNAVLSGCMEVEAMLRRVGLPMSFWGISCGRGAAHLRAKLRPASGKPVFPREPAQTKVA